jgi:cAMP-binding proteins - catabolite gene activator and regulatory subunit of cAMP-dependent protein kinases
MLMRTQATSTKQGNFRHPVAGIGKAATLSGSIEMMGASMPFARNVEVYGEDEPAEYVYKVISGAVRTYKLLGDGRRQIGNFYLPGDIFGLEAGEHHRFTAEAITDSTILVIKRSAVVSLARSDRELSHQLWQLTAQELEHVQTLLLLLGRKNAQERVAAFLLEMAGRVPAGNAVELPMSRQDIADYLGLTIETVSRTLTQLEDAAAIALPTSRRVVLRDRAALNRLNG